MSEMKFGFFFGAGAEKCYGLPEGSKFTVDTMCCRRKNMYDELLKFYAKRNDTEYAEKYKKYFHFQENSASFRKMVRAAADRIENDSVECEIDLKNMFLLYDVDVKSKNKEEKNKNDLNEIIKKIYNVAILDLEEPCKENKHEKYIDTIIKNFGYCNAIEGRFSAIINPKEADIDFWKLINYFWSCYMTIMRPLLKNSLEGKALDEFKGNNYRYILDDLSRMLNHIDPAQNKTFFENYQSITGFDYYRAFKGLKPECILTTNYTPFIEQFDTKKKSYLAGELRDFEVPNEFIIDHFDNIDNVDEKFIFPYMLTQAPVKPIINPRQIEVYANALNYLKDIDTLVIVGYGFNGSDDHINAMLNDFLCKKKKKIIYWDFIPSKDKKNEWDESKKKSKLMKKLRIKELSDKNLLEVVRVDEGDEGERLEELKVKLNIK